MLFAKKDDILTSVTAQNALIFLNAGYEIVQQAFYTLTEDEVYAIVEEAAKSGEVLLNTEANLLSTEAYAEVKKPSIFDSNYTVDSTRVTLSNIPELAGRRYTSSVRELEVPHEN